MEEIRQIGVQWTVSDSQREDRESEGPVHFELQAVYNWAAVFEKKTLEARDLSQPTGQTLEFGPPD